MAEIDEEVKEEMRKKVELAVSDEKELRRAELNFYAELLPQLKKLNKELDEVYSLLADLGADKLTKYFVELTKNVKKEQAKKK